MTFEYKKLKNKEGKCSNGVKYFKFLRILYFGVARSLKLTTAN